MQIDTLNIQVDSIPVQLPDSIPVAIDTAQPFVDTNQKVEPVIYKPVVTKTVSQPSETTEKISIGESDSVNRDSIIHATQSAKPFILFAATQTNDSSVVKKQDESISWFQPETKAETITAQLRNETLVFEKEWVFGISVFITLLVIIIRTYYQKYLASVVSSMLNIQLAEKILREKSVLVKRGNFLLNICFVFSLGLYFYITADRFNLDLPMDNLFYKYFYLVLVISGVLVIRLILIRLTAIIFDSIPVYREYIHNSFIINKNLGLYLMPLMASYFFVSNGLGQILYITGTVIIIITILFRYLKAIQIIFKHNVFLFYSILYLCTLEILPTLIGIKFVLTLR